MARKLIVVWLSVTMITFSSVSIYATSDEKENFFIPYAPLDANISLLASTHEAGVLNAEWEKESRTTAAEKAAEEKRLKKERRENKLIKGMAAYIRHINSNVSKKESRVMARSFVKYSKKYNVDEKIIMAVAQNESTYYSNAVSSCRHKGLMQTGDGLARNAGYTPEDLFNPRISIKVGARYLHIKMKEFGDTRLALTAYNQGSGSVRSGNYSTGYADLAMERADEIEEFLNGNGYTE